MKYLLTYQILSVNPEDLKEIYRLNDEYQKQDKLNPSQDKAVDIYKKFLPQSSRPFYLLSDNNYNLLHLKSDMGNELLNEFTLTIDKKELKFNNSQANFRLIQNYAWATQFKEKAGSDSKPMALAYVYELTDEAYVDLCKIYSTSENKIPIKAI